MKSLLLAAPLVVPLLVAVWFRRSRPGMRLMLFSFVVVNALAIIALALSKPGVP